MTRPTLFLLALVGSLQFPLWLSDGSWPEIWAQSRQNAENRHINDGLLARNAALAAEVEDLREARDALEERARSELGMIRPGETYVRLVSEPPAANTP
jgi:cell division protein FtsB